MCTETFEDGKNVKTCEENNDESGSSRSSDSSSVVIDGCGSSRHSEGVKPEIILESDNVNESSTHINSSGMKSKASTDSIGFAQKDEQNDLSSESSANFEDDNSTPGCSPASQVYDGIHELGMSLTSRPPVQLMSRSTEYDPSRIPASLFDNPNNTKEWSLASNESLFSIRLDNISFSRNQAHGEIGKSMELNESFDLNTFSLFSPVSENTGKSRKSDAKEDLRRTETADEVSERVIEIQKDVKNSYPALSCSSSSVSGYSHGSGRTFIDKEEGQGCYCNCSRPNCFCLKPSCRCFNCCWLVCYCCSSCKRKRRHKNAISGADTKSFAEAEARRQISEKVPELDSSSKAKNRCWHCLSWPWSRCGNLCSYWHCFSWPWLRCGNCCSYWHCFSWPWSRCGNCCWHCFSWPWSGCGNCCCYCHCFSWPWSRCGNCCCYCHCC